MHKILIVDDDARWRRTVKQVVAGLADEVFEAADGSEALALCALERPDWVVMDVRMKPVDGIRTTAQIKGRFPETRIAILSQYDEVGLRAEAARLGACAYVLKEDFQDLPVILTGSRAPSHDTGSGVPPRPKPQ
jgi:CheY-like chemotaxis protein